MKVVWYFSVFIVLFLYNVDPLNLECRVCGNKGNVKNAWDCADANTTKVKCYYDWSLCYSFYLHYTFTYAPVKKNKTWECAYKHQKKQRPKVKKFQEKECTEINGTNITHLANFTDLENPYHFFPNKTYNFTATGNYIWEYIIEFYEEVPEPVNFMHFQKGCTDRNRSMCYNKIEKVKRDVNNSKTGKLEKKEFIIPAEKWQIDTVNGSKKYGTYYDCKYLSCNSSNECNSDTSIDTKGKHKLSAGQLNTASMSFIMALVMIQMGAVRLVCYII